MRIADPRDILLAPVISEKSYGLLDENKYTFIVAPDANKTQIKIAVEQVFGVKVTGVNTINRQGKRTRTRFGFGKRADTKRAIVSLADGDRITGLFVPPGIVRYFFNGAPIGEIADPSFARAFFGIWLDARTTAPDLRASLLKQAP